ncbi:hypothetical protein C5167_013673 [Papaver somniferum]|uniref:Uncharacterized protein n=1 Tax=Papaver somniferum TaxID=3469 RepID=A0A4Y7J4F4_PAPSO|nr:hypothetical protein C5167_013673 [Papaver somniferum]
MIKSTELKNSSFEEETKEKDKKRKKRGEENDRLAIVHESSSRIRSMSWTNYSLTEKEKQNIWLIGQVQLRIKLKK